jgi:hypothetical protein
MMPLEQQLQLYCTFAVLSSRQAAAIFVLGVALKLGNAVSATSGGMSHRMTYTRLYDLYDTPIYTMQLILLITNVPIC